MPKRTYSSEVTEKRRQAHREWLKKNHEHSRAWVRAYYRKNHEKIRAQAKVRSLKKRYGISPEHLELLLKAVNHKCPVCLNSFDNKGHKVCVDHCHNTGVIRGVLCIKCNFAEGALGTPEAVLRLYDYMKRNELFYQGVN